MKLFKMDWFLLKLFLLYLAIVAGVFYLLIQPGKPRRGPSPSGMSDDGVIIVLFAVLVLPFLIILTVSFCCLCCWHRRRLKRLECKHKEDKQTVDKKNTDKDAKSSDTKKVFGSKKYH